MRPYSAVDGVLILLLFTGVFFALAQWLLFLIYVRRDKYWNKPRKREQVNRRRRIYDHLYHNPRSVLRHEYPHLADVAEATKAYERLGRLYDEGLIDEIDYNIELEKLLPKINIEQDF